MESFQPRRVGDARPEARIQKDIIDFMTLRGWFVKPCPASALTSGWPDLFSTHSRYGIRWIEVKKPGMVGSKFTPAQLEVFPKFSANGAGVWILTWADQDQYNRLFKEYNWATYKLRDVARQLDIKYIRLFEKKFGKKGFQE